MSVINITSDNFENEVIKSEIPVLVDFWASWCGPCKMIAPIIESIANEVPGVKVCKVNVDEELELAKKYGVMNIPTLILIENGKVVGTSIGMKSKTEIIEFIG